MKGGRLLSGRIFGLPLLRLDFANLYDKYHGETERNLRESLNTADVLSPCVLWIDEIEMGVAGYQGGEGSAGIGLLFEAQDIQGLAVLPGGGESLGCHPQAMTHAPVSEKALAEAGIANNLIRLSVGIESTEDLVVDVLEALEVARNAVALKPVAVA